MIADEQNFKLAAISTKEEIKSVVFSHDKDSATSPDSFTVYFFQTCWEIVAIDVGGYDRGFFLGCFNAKGNY